MLLGSRMIHFAPQNLLIDLECQTFTNSLTRRHNVTHNTKIKKKLQLITISDIAVLF